MQVFQKWPCFSEKKTSWDRQLFVLPDGCPSWRERICNWCLLSLSAEWEHFWFFDTKKNTADVVFEKMLVVLFGWFVGRLVGFVVLPEKNNGKGNMALIFLRLSNLKGTLLTFTVVFRQRPTYVFCFKLFHYFGPWTTPRLCQGFFGFVVKLAYIIKSF